MEGLAKSLKRWWARKDSNLRPMDYENNTSKKNYIIQVVTILISSCVKSVSSTPVNTPSH